MTDERENDLLLHALGTLAPVTPDRQVAEDLRGLCRDALEREPQPLTTGLEPATVTSICALYAWEIVRVVIR